ncbi:hypothetical protein EOM89_10025, partial [Candidatus Falkowbacteria bacterium]|nr:hypothetical protein [Candidatus Falkowbacteria bacterium]
MSIDLGPLRLTPPVFLAPMAGITDLPFRRMVARFGAGLGLSFPNGLSSQWGDDSFARYVSTYSSLTVADISPAFGYKLNDHLKVGAGFNVYYSRAKLENMVDMGLASGFCLRRC